MTNCSVDGCPNEHSAKGLCRFHYRRQRRGIPLDTPRMKQPYATDATCATDGCNNKPAGRGLCKSHYRRDYQGITRPEGHDRDWWKEIGYASAHRRVKGLWGAAKHYLCVNDCGRWASQWAYDGTDPQQLFGTTTAGTYCSYSIHPEFYMPMCRSCHGQRDGAERVRELASYRQFRYATGRTLDDFPEEIIYRPTQKEEREYAELCLSLP